MIGTLVRFGAVLVLLSPAARAGDFVTSAQWAKVSSMKGDFDKLKEGAQAERAKQAFVEAVAAQVPGEAIVRGPELDRFASEHQKGFCILGTELYGDVCFTEKSHVTGTWYVRTEGHVCKISVDYGLLEGRRSSAPKNAFHTPLSADAVTCVASSKG